MYSLKLELYELEHLEEILFHEQFRILENLEQAANQPDRVEMFAADLQLTISLHADLARTRQLGDQDCPVAAKEALEATSASGGPTLRAVETAEET